MGIRAETTSDGTIEVNVTGRLEAKTPVQVIGGRNNVIVTPPVSQANAALDRAVSAFATRPTLHDASGGENGQLTLSLAEDNALHLGFGSGARFGALEMLPDDDTFGVRTMLGMRFELGGLSLTPALLFGAAEMDTRAPHVSSRRDVRQHGLALRVDRGGARFDAAWFRSRFETTTKVRVPDFSLNLREPQASASLLRLGAGFALGANASVRLHWDADLPSGRDDATHHRFGALVQVPLPLH